MLAVDLDRSARDIAQQGRRNRRATGECATAAIGLERPAKQQRLARLVINSRSIKRREGWMANGKLERRADDARAASAVFTKAGMLTRVGPNCASSRAVMLVDSWLTLAAACPERTSPTSDRAPSASPSESSRIDLPAPVSPVSTPRPGSNSSSSRSISTTSLMTSCLSIATRF